MHRNTQIHHLRIKPGTVCIFLGGDKMHFHPHLSPNLNLVIKLGPRTAVKGWKSNNIERMYH